MAQTLEFNLLCAKMLKIDCFPCVTIKRITRIDDWFWTNQQEYDDLSSLEEDLCSGMIYVVELCSEHMGEFGVFIEKSQGIYEYCVWVNSDTFSTMDEFGLTAKDEPYLEQFYNLLKTVQDKFNIQIQALGIGFETTFRHEKDVQSTIEQSENIIIWVVNDVPGFSKILDGYQKRILGSGLVAYEKWK